MNSAIGVISIVNIEYVNGYFQVFEMNTPISKHSTLAEAQWIKSVLDSDSSNNASSL